jgi:VCBS repeat-containing protein
MTYTPGRHCLAEAQRIEFLNQRSADTAKSSARQIMLTYLSAIENPHAYPSQRSVRGDFVDSIQELASFLQEEALTAIEALPAGTDLFAYLDTFRVHPADRAAHTVQINVDGTLSSELEADLKALSTRYGCSLSVNAAR